MSREALDPAAAASPADSSGGGVSAVDAVLEHLDPAAAIVTVASDGVSAGCLVTFFMQASMDPLRFIVCLSKQNRTYRVARSADSMVLHVLGAEEADLAELFGGHSGDDIDKFARCGWSPAADGTPVLDRAPQWVRGSILDRVDTGDHVAFLLDAIDVAAPRRPVPLRFGDIRGITPGHLP